ncbi:M20 family metallopeptidase [Mycolicibacterium sp.]|uniref:M20 family metallopeptidase n=1 Tax=Mycolicibacterium sp. TaxID=2320850 RepID=UPI003D104047
MSDRRRVAEIEAVPTSEVVALARELVRTDTVNPPGGEQAVAEQLAARLHAQAIPVEVLPFAAGRANLLARLPGRDSSAPALMLSGHLDTVAAGHQPWTREVRSGDIVGDRLHGRGASDMKGGVAAMLVAFEAAAAGYHGRGDIVLALTGAEESGCQGARALLPNLGRIGAVVVGEPTAGRVAVGHKGVLWVTLSASGRSAHASAPELGVNAIDRMTRVLAGVLQRDISASAEGELGRPTLTVTTISGGVARNIVPDSCTAQLDIRLTDAFSRDDALELVRAVAATSAGADVVVDLDLPSVLTPVRDSWVSELLHELGLGATGKMTMNYFTDASVFGPALGVPVILYGPGEPTQAHQTDEWCSVSRIEESVEVYAKMIRWWGRSPR